MGQNLPLDPSILTVEIDIKDQNLTSFIVKDQFKIWNRGGITQRLMIVPKFDAFSSSNIARTSCTSGEYHEWLAIVHTFTG